MVGRTLASITLGLSLLLMPVAANAQLQPLSGQLQHPDARAGVYLSFPFDSAGLENPGAPEFGFRAQRMQFDPDAMLPGRQSFQNLEQVKFALDTRGDVHLALAGEEMSIDGSGGADRQNMSSWGWVGIGIGVGVLLAAGGLVLACQHSNCGD